MHTFSLVGEGKRYEQVIDAKNSSLKLEVGGTAQTSLKVFRVCEHRCEIKCDCKKNRRHQRVW